MTRNIDDYPDALWLDAGKAATRWDIGEDYPVHFCKECGDEVTPEDGCESCGTRLYAEDSDED